DVAACAGTVVHDDLLADDLAQLASDHADQKIARTAGRLRNDDAYRLRRVRLAVCRPHPRECEHENELPHRCAFAGTADFACLPACVPAMRPNTAPDTRPVPLG